MGDVIDRMLTAMAEYDAEAVRELSTPGLRRWLSITEEETGLDDLVATIETERAVVATAAFTLKRRIDTADGAVLMLSVEGSTKRGSAFHIPVCLVLTTEGDRVSRIDEYANLERAKGLITEMFGS